MYTSIDWIFARSKKGWPKRLTTGVSPPGKISLFETLLKYAFRLSMSCKQRRKGVLALTTWKRTVPIGSCRSIDPIDGAVPMPNWTVTEPAVLLFNSTGRDRCIAWNCSSPAVEAFEAPVSIMMSMKSLEPYLSPRM